MLCGREGNRRSGVDFSGLSTYGLTANVREMSTPPTPIRAWSALPLPFTCCTLKMVVINFSLHFPHFGAYVCSSYLSVILSLNCNGIVDWYLMVFICCCFINVWHDVWQSVHKDYKHRVRVRLTVDSWVNIDCAAGHSVVFWMNGHTATPSKFPSTVTRQRLVQLPLLSRTTKKPVSFHLLLVANSDRSRDIRVGRALKVLVLRHWRGGV